MSGFGIARLGDLDTGHSSWPSRPIIQASPDFFVENKAVAREGDALAIHCNPDNCHPGVIASGSSTVFANNKRVARISDPVSCGGTILGGATRTNAG